MEEIGLNWNERELFFQIVSYHSIWAENIPCFKAPQGMASENPWCAMWDKNIGVLVSLNTVVDIFFCDLYDRLDTLSI